MELLARDVELMRLYNAGVRDFAGLSAEDRFRFASLLGALMHRMENLLAQSKLGLLPKEAWQGAAKRIRETLILDLLEWIGATPRSYEDVMNAWRTSCPRLTIWEDALDAGLLAVRDHEVQITEKGFELLKMRRNLVKVDRIHLGVG